MIPVLSYARISSDTERDEHGVESQHKRNRETARRLGWRVVSEITDNDLSASKVDVYREGFERLVKALALGRLEDGKEIGGVLVVEQSRLARRQSDWERFTDALTIAPGRVYAESGREMDPYDDAFELHGTFNTYTNKREAKKIAQRTKASHLDRAMQGRPVGGSRPFGWSGDRRTLDPVEAAYARKAVADFLAGRTINAIVRDLQAAKVTTTKGNAWTADAMRKYLGNPRLCGWRMLRGEVVRNADGSPVAGEWQPICTADEWLAINARLESRRGQRFDGNGKPLGPLHRDWSETKYLLTGVARCGKPHTDRAVCMAPMRGAHQRDCKSHSYLCPTKTNGGCAGTGRNGARLEAFVIEAVLARAEAETLKRADIGEWEGEPQLHALTERRNAMSKAFAAGAVSPEVAFDTETGLPFFESQIKGLRAERERHAAKRAEAQAMPANVRAEWEARAEDLSWRRAFIRKWLHSVLVFPVPKGTKVWREDSVRLVWRES